LVFGEYWRKSGGERKTGIRKGPQGVKSLAGHLNGWEEGGGVTSMNDPPPTSVCLLLSSIHATKYVGRNRTKIQHYANNSVFVAKSELKVLGQN